MKKFKIQICLLGYQRYLDKIEKLQNYSSKLFEVTNCIVPESVKLSYFFTGTA